MILPPGIFSGAYDNPPLEFEVIDEKVILVRYGDSQELKALNLQSGLELVEVNGIPIDSLGYFGIYDLLADTSIDEYQLLVDTTNGDIEDVTLSVQP